MKHRDLLLLLISISLLVLFWIGFSIYHNYVTSKVPEALSIQILPINPDFDTKIIEKIKKRKIVPPVYESVSNITGTPVPATAEATIAPSVTPIPSISLPANLTPTINPTGGV